MSFHQKKIYQEHVSSVCAVVALLLLAALFALRLEFEMGIAFVSAAALIWPLALMVPERQQAKLVISIAACCTLLGGLLITSHCINQSNVSSEIQAPAQYEESASVIYKLGPIEVTEHHRVSGL